MCMISVCMDFSREEFYLLLFCSKIVKRTKTNFGIRRIKIPIPTFLKKRYKTPYKKRYKIRYKIRTKNDTKTDSKTDTKSNTKKDAKKDTKFP